MEASGWALPRKGQRLIVVGGAVFAGIFAALTESFAAGLGFAALAAFVLASMVLQFDPVFRNRLIVGTGSLTDPEFERRVSRVNLGVVAFYVSALSGPAASAVDPHSLWRPVLWTLFAVGLIVAAIATAPAALWLWRRRRLAHPTICWVIRVRAGSSVGAHHLVQPPNRRPKSWVRVVSPLVHPDIPLRQTGGETNM